MNIRKFLKVTFIDEIDGSFRKAIVSIDRIDRIVEYIINDYTSKNLINAKSVLYFKTSKDESKDYRYLVESVDEIQNLEY